MNNCKPGFFFLIWISLFFFVGGCIFPAFWTEEYSREAGNEYVENQEDISPDVLGGNVVVSPQKPVKGGLARVEISPFPYPPLALELKNEDYNGSVSEFYWNGKEINVLLGVSYHNEAAVYDLKLQIEFMGHRRMVLPLELEVEEGNYPRQEFSVPPSVTAGWDAERIKREREKLEETRQVNTRELIVEDYFIWPVENWEEEGYVSSEYGAERVINHGEPRRHDGIDIAIEGGTPVVAPSCGKVVLAEELLAPGKTVVIDHGLGITSSYLHLSEIKAEAGETISQGEKIGEVGKTGFSTGNHLHWSVHVKDTPVNPELFLEDRGEEILGPFLGER